MSHKNIFDESALEPVQRMMLQAIRGGDIREIGDAFACNGPRPDKNCPLVMVEFIKRKDEIIDQLAQDTNNAHRFLADRMMIYADESQKVFLKMKYGV